MAIKVINKLKDGTIIDDLTGHLVRYEDCPNAYHIVVKCLNEQEEKQCVNPD